MKDTDLVKWLLECSSFSLVAWLLMQTFSKTLPTLTDQFRADLQRERDGMKKSLEGVTEALERLSVILIYHDATVRGKDPSALGSTEEILRLLRGKAGRPYE